MPGDGGTSGHDCHHEPYEFVQDDFDVASDVYSITDDHSSVNDDHEDDDIYD